MKPVRLPESLKRIAGLDRRHATLAVGAAVAAALAIAAGLAVARSGPLETEETAQRLATTTRGDISDRGLKRLVVGMDAAALDLARRFDTAAGVDDQPGWRPGDPPRVLEFQPVDGAEARRINAAIAFTQEAVSPAAPFFLRAASTAERERAVRCLANAIYYEAALEPVDGQRAVAQVVVNRLRDPNFPKSVCGVVYQGWERVTGCQFSFTCDGALVRSPIPALWEETRKVAEAALNGYVQKSVGAATHYHADYVAPYWAPGLVKITQIGAHIFYRWPGAAGTVEALNAAYAGGELRLSEAVLTGRAARPTPFPTAAAPGPDAPQVIKVLVTDPTTGETHARVQSTITPYGRRAPTAEEIARINAILEARFPTKAGDAPAAEPKPAEPAAPLAAAATAAAG